MDRLELKEKIIDELMHYGDGDDMDCCSRDINELINWIDDLLEENEKLKSVNKPITQLGHPVRCPICSEEMKGIELTHYKCKHCNEYFTN
jgi:hypothetical protein